MSEPEVLLLDEPLSNLDAKLRIEMAVPMASRVANEIALKYDPKNHVLQYCMASNISGVIGSAVAAGVLISFLQ